MFRVFQKGGGSPNARRIPQSPLYSQRLVVFTVFQSGGGLPKCAPHPAEHSTESAFSGVYSLPDLLRVFSYVCCVLCVVCCALCGVCVLL